LRQLVALSLLFTALNSVKPLQVDDAAYYYYAAQIARHPLDPYGFEIFWYQHPEPANEVLAPPVLPYWWAAAIRLFGDHPVAWKLWLLPFSLLFVFSLDALFWRFARGLETPLVWMTVLSPTFLPSLNLMLDVPASALSIGGLVLFFRACDRNSFTLATAAGLTAGLAMETKYTSFLAPAVMLIYVAVVCLHVPGVSWPGRLRTVQLGLTAACISAAVFAGWECLMAWRYGESHFLGEFRRSEHDFLRKFLWSSLPLLSLLGGVGPPCALLGLAAAGRRVRTIAVAGFVTAVGYLAVAYFPFTAVYDLPPLPIVGLGDVSTISVSLEEAIFTFFGVVMAGVVAATAWRLLRVGHWQVWRPEFWHRRRVDRFLVLWLCLELMGYFALTPFAAVRRVMGIIIVVTLMVGRLASSTCLTRASLALVRWSAVVGILLGFLFYTVDLRDAFASRAVAERAAAFVRKRDSAAMIWYVGHWGFQFYAERCGMRPVIPAAHAGRQPLRSGDWLVVPSARIEQQALAIPSNKVEQIVEIVSQDWLPWRTVQCFYGTSTGVPLETHHGPRAFATIYRVISDFKPVAEEESALSP
jgi:hypothetical protein